MLVKKIPLHGIQPAPHACNATQFTEILQGAKIAKLKKKQWAGFTPG